MLKNDWERNKADTLSAFGKFLLNNVWISITVVALTLLLSGAFLWYDKYDSTETIKDFYHQNTYNGDIGYFDEQLDTIKDDLDDISTYVAWEKYKDFVPLETENKYTLEESKNIVYEIEYGDVENINNMVSGFSVEEQEKFKKLKETELENQRLYGYNYYEVDEVDMYFTELIKENSEQLEDVVLSYRLKLKSEENSEEINEFLQENIVIKVKTFIYTSMNLSGEMNLDTYKKFSDVEKYKYVLLEENIVDSLDILVLVLYGVVGYSMLIFFWIHTMKNSKRINRQDFFEKYSEEFYEKFKSMNRFS